VLASAKRGEEFVVKPKATYRSGYDWEDICELGARIRDPRDELTLAIIRKNPSEYKVPYGTMRSWCAPQGPQGAPLWLVERDQRRRHSLPQSGGVKGGGTTSYCSSDYYCTVLSGTQDYFGSISHNKLL